MAYDKIVDSAALDGALTDIADAIRLKTDSAAPIALEDMPLQISLIGGSFGGGEMQTITGTFMGDGVVHNGNNANQPPVQIPCPFEPFAVEIHQRNYTAAFPVSSCCGMVSVKDVFGMAWWKNTNNANRSSGESWFAFFGQTPVNQCRFTYIDGVVNIYAAAYSRQFVDGEPYDYTILGK